MIKPLTRTKSRNPTTQRDVTPPGRRQVNLKDTQSAGSVKSKSQAARRRLTLSQSKHPAVGLSHPRSLLPFQAAFAARIDVELVKSVCFEGYLSLLAEREPRHRLPTLAVGQQVNNRLGLVNGPSSSHL